MTEQAGGSPNKYTNKARLWEMMLGVVRLLEGEPEGLQVREVLTRLKMALPPHGVRAHPRLVGRAPL